MCEPERAADDEDSFISKVEPFDVYRNMVEKRMIWAK